MRTALNIDDDLLAEAQRLSHVTAKVALVRGGLHALIERESARRLAKLLNNIQVLMHPSVSGELACGDLTNRAAFAGSATTYFSCL